MKQHLVITLVLVLIFQPGIWAQKGDMYVAIKTGLSIRDKPGEGAKVIGKIPYGTKLTIGTGAITETRIITEGLYGY
jgi:uncharacterized protein YgiM (DUF1202 family)